MLFLQYAKYFQQRSNQRKFSQVTERLIRSPWPPEESQTVAEMTHHVSETFNKYILKAKIYRKYAQKNIRCSIHHLPVHCAQTDPRSAAELREQSVAVQINRLPAVSPLMRLPVWFVAEHFEAARPLRLELYELWVMQSMAARSHSQNLCWHQSEPSARQNTHQLMSISSASPAALSLNMIVSETRWLNNHETDHNMKLTTEEKNIYSCDVLKYLQLPVETHCCCLLTDRRIYFLAWKQISFFPQNVKLFVESVNLTTAAVCLWAGEVVWERRQLRPAGGSAQVTPPVSLTAAAATDKPHMLLCFLYFKWMYVM